MSENKHSKYLFPPPIIGIDWGRKEERPVKITGDLDRTGAFCVTGIHQSEEKEKKR